METKRKTEVPIYKFLSRKLQQIKNLEVFLERSKPGDISPIQEKIQICEEELEQCIKKYLPSGSGFDAGTKLLDASTPEKLMFRADFHHLNENGYYDGWSEHVVTVKPSLCFDIEISVSGRNRNDIKEYILDTFNYALKILVDEHTGA